MVKILGIIPARFASTRFAGKPLAEISGKSMIRRVFEQAQKSSLKHIVVATDDARIFEHVVAFGGKAVMTSPQHASGTDRCREALDLQWENFDYVINIQGDEPFIAPAQIDLLSSLLDGSVELATLMKSIDNEYDLFNPNVVKIITTAQGNAIYFSRAAIPFQRSHPPSEWHTHHSYFKHIGMYAYRSDTLHAISRLPISSLEKSESLEQLRWIENGFRIKVATTQQETIGVDTPEDLQKAETYLRANSLS
jgi:3-deoxy-manno-octulosonate cytidylyltransferase (CMP-KDO synthetase)